MRTAPGPYPKEAMPTDSNPGLETESLSAFLRSILDQKKQLRRGMSLRALARHLGVSPAMLSSVMQGKRGFSPANVTRILERLNLTETDREIFLLLSDLYCAQHPPTHRCIRQRIEAIRSKANDRPPEGGRPSTLVWN